MATRYGDLLKEFYEGIRSGTLPQNRLDEIQRQFNELSNREDKYESWLRPQDNKISAEKLDTALFSIYSQVLEQNYDSIVITIPPGVKHLVVQGNGGITASSGGTIWVEFNGDSGANYEDTYILGNGTSVSTGNGISLTHAILGLFSNTNDPVGNSSSFNAYINHIQSAYHKMVLTNTYYNDGTTRGLYVVGNKWKSTSPITQMEIYGADSTGTKGTAQLASGSSLSIYGMK